MAETFIQFLQDRASEGEVMAIELAAMIEHDADVNFAATVQTLRELPASNWQIACLEAFRAEWRGEEICSEMAVPYQEAKRVENGDVFP